MPKKHNIAQLTINPEEDSWDEVYQRISWWDAEAIAKAWVLVVGAGALGNEVLKNLALLGVGHIVVIDFDHIEYSNLSRSVLFRAEDCGQQKSTVAARRIRELNPNTEIIPLHGDVIYDLGLGLIRRMDVVIGCLDNRVARLYINKHCYKVNKIWIDGGIENLAGRMDVFIPDTTCYECQLSKREWEVIDKRMSCTDVAQRNANFGRIATTPISSSIIGAMQVQEAMKVIFGNHDKLLTAKRFFMEGMSNEVMFYSSATPKENCLDCSRYSTIIESKLSSQNTLSETLDELEKILDVSKVTILLDYSIALAMVTPKSNKDINIIIPKPQISDSFIRKHEEIPGEGLVIKKGRSTNRLNRDFPALEMTLSSLSIPPLQVLKVESLQGISYIELSGDLNKYFPNLEKK